MPEQARGGPLFVNHASQPSGAELVLLDVVRGFPGASVFLFEDGPLRAALETQGAAVIVAPGGRAFGAIKRDRSLWRAAPHLAGLARLGLALARAAGRFELLYANSQKAFVVAAAAAMVRRRRLVWHLHDILAPGHFGAGQIRLAVGLANRCASRVIVPSAAAGAAFTEAGGRASLLRVVPNGVDVAADGPAERVLPQPFVFGVFSRLAPWKGQEVALRALAALPEAGCVIAGGALFGEDDYAAGLERLAGELGVADRVRFLGHRADVPALMRGVDAVVHPSVQPEPFGRTLVEAMALRRPVVAAAAGAVPEILDEGRAGWLVPPGDPAALAAALRRVAAGEGTAAVERALCRARTLYGAARMREGVQAVVAELES